MNFLLLKGFFIGILIAFPTGPVGFLTLRRSYLFGMRSAMYSTLGAVITDAFFGIVVGFGLTKIAKFLVMIATYAELVAGIALIFIGIRSYYHVLDLEHHEGENTPLTDITSSAFLNILNPALIFSFTILFTLMGMQKFVGNASAILLFLIGIGTGSFLFWFLVSKGINKLHNQAKSHYIQKANKYTGMILGVIGVVLLVLSIYKFFTH